jgi:hypothetical protein
LPLQKHLLFGLKALKGKQHDMLTQGIASLEHPDIEPLFPIFV